jgi:hypothetical protein
MRTFARGLLLLGSASVLWQSCTKEEGEADDASQSTDGFSDSLGMGGASGTVSDAAIVSPDVGASIDVVSISSDAPTCIAPCIWNLLQTCGPGPDEACSEEMHDDTLHRCFASGIRWVRQGGAVTSTTDTRTTSTYRSDGTLCLTAVTTLEGTLFRDGNGVPVAELDFLLSEGDGRTMTVRCADGTVYFQRPDNTCLSPFQVTMCSPGKCM